MNLGLQCVVKKAESMAEASLKAGSVERNHRSVPLASTKSAALLQQKSAACCSNKCRLLQQHFRLLQQVKLLAKEIIAENFFFNDRRVRLREMLLCMTRRHWKVSYPALRKPSRKQSKDEQYNMTYIGDLTYTSTLSIGDVDGLTA